MQLSLLTAVSIAFSFDLSLLQTSCSVGTGIWRSDRFPDVSRIT